MYTVNVKKDRKRGECFACELKLPVRNLRMREVVVNGNRVIVQELVNPDKHQTRKNIWKK